jgi:hypothetical protein
MNKIAKEVAEKEFEKWCDYVDIELDDLTPEEIKSMESHRRTIVRAIMKGAACVDENGQLSYTSQRTAEPQKYTFKEVSGATLVSMEKAEGNFARQFVVLSEVTGRPAGELRKLTGRDLTFMQTVFILLMA